VDAIEEFHQIQGKQRTVPRRPNHAIVQNLGRFTHRRPAFDSLRVQVDDPVLRDTNVAVKISLFDTIDS
jgi:hypothetical protein